MRDNYITVKKPWGYYTIIIKKQHYWVKKLVVKRGHRLSLQSHKEREEFWFVLSGEIDATKGSSDIKLGKLDFLKINKGEKHRIKGIVDSDVLEIAVGNVKERDIIRYEDDYGRIRKQPSLVERYKND